MPAGSDRASIWAIALRLVLAFVLVAFGAATVRAQVDTCESDPDSDGDGFGDPCDPCPADPDKRAPGHCGCGAPEEDPDGDGVPSCIDNCATVANLGQADLDGDGLGDACECPAGGCAPGGGNASDADCVAQLVPSAGLGVDGATLTCADGAPCDADPAPDQCGFRFGLCFGSAAAASACSEPPPQLVRFEVPSASSGQGLLEAIAALPGAYAVGEASVALFPREAGVPECTAPAVVSVPAGEHELELNAENDASGASDRDRYALVCQAAPSAPPAPAEESPPLRCQREIERGGAKIARTRLGAVSKCARTVEGASLACSEVTSDQRIFRLQGRWYTDVVDACAGVDVHELGYLASCGPAGSPCAFAAPVLSANGPSNDLLDCLSCQIKESVRRLARGIIPPGVHQHPCAHAISVPGAALTKQLWRELSSCLGKPEAVSIAACLTEPKRRARLEVQVAKWRAQVDAACGTTDVLQLGYTQLCANLPPATPPQCADGAPPCNLFAGNRGNRPGGDNDRVDCNECQANEAALDLARTIYGAEVCCTERGCNTVRSRASCAIIGGHPAYYAMSSLLGGHSVNGAHAIGIAADGDVLLPVYAGPVRAIDPADGSVEAIGVVGDFPVGFATDAAGNLYGALRYEHFVSRLSPAEVTTSFVGLPADPGHDGDGGYADAARISAPDGVTVDAFGNVYANDSGFVATGLTGAPVNTGEWLRRVDAAGRVATVAGSGTYGTEGMGGDALDARLAMPYSLAARASGTVVIGEAGGQRVLELEPGGRLLPLAGRPLGIVGGYSGDGGLALDARFHGAEGVAEDPDGLVYVADFRNSRIRLIDALGSVITIAGNGKASQFGQPNGDGGPGPNAVVGCPAAIAVDAAGRVFFPDLFSDRVRILTPVLY